MIEALLGGIFFKIIDEVEDVGYKYLNEYKEYIKTLCTVFTTLALYNNVYLTIFCILVLTPASYFANEIDTEYWNTLLPIPFIILALTYQNIDHRVLLQNSCFFILMFICIFFEPLFIPEETSFKKNLSRFLAILFAIIMLLWSNNTALHSFMYFIIGYGATSVVFKILLAPYAMSETAVQKAMPPSFQQLDKTHQAP